MKVAIGGILAGFVVSWLYGARCDSSAAGAVMNPRRRSFCVLAAIRFLSDCGTYWRFRHLAAVAAGMTITRSGVMRRAPWQCACAQTAPGRCWNLSLTAGVPAVRSAVAGDSGDVADGAEIDPNVEIWMLFTDIILIYRR